MAARKMKKETKKDDLPNDRLNAILDKYKGDCEAKTTYISLDLSSEGTTYRSMISDYARSKSGIDGNLRRPRIVFEAVGKPSAVVRMPPKRTQ